MPAATSSVSFRYFFTMPPRSGRHRSSDGRQQKTNDWRRLEMKILNRRVFTSWSTSNPKHQMSVWLSWAVSGGGAAVEAHTICLYGSRRHKMTLICCCGTFTTFHRWRRARDKTSSLSVVIHPKAISIYFCPFDLVLRYTELAGPKQTE